METLHGYLNKDYKCRCTIRKLCCGLP